LLAPELGADRYTDMARGLLSGDGKISRYFRWATLFNSPRRKIVAEIERLYGGADRVRLFTPALIDFSRWLDDEPRSNLESQVRVMERIQRLERPSIVHCFAPYDPWREIVDQENGGGNTALDLVKWAINDMGFIGVKLYPPMGFMPAGNEGANLAYPERAGDIPQFTKKLDKALDDLFSWAASQGVPIMAHSADSNGAGPGYSGRASPANWRPVLEKYPDLRLNLAHFGGFEKSLAGGQDWEDIRVALVSSGARNLYADVGYLSEILPDQSDQAEMQRLSAAFARYVASSDVEVEHLMFATDWIMLGQEGGFADYFETVDRFVQAAGITGEKRNRFLGGNAARFLGLGRNEPARTRLEAYYQAKGLDRTRLDLFGS
jgi:predicted TIM-barrel fold metal-dependent hydrolase